MSEHRYSKFICHSYYVLFGMVGSGIFPALMKSFEDAYGLTHARMGLLMGLCSVLMAVSGIVAGHWYDRAGARAPLLACLLTSAGFATALFVDGSTMLFVVAMLGYAIANGIGIIVNPLIRKLYGDRHTGGLNLMHAFQGAGRFLSPLLVVACIAFLGGWRSSLLIASVLFFIWFVLLLMGPRLSEPVAVTPTATREDGRGNRSLWHNRLIWLGLIAFFFHTGCELCLIFWMPNYIESEAGQTKQVALAVLTCTMAGSMLARFALGRVKGHAPSWMMAGFAVGIVLGIAWIVNASSVWELYAAGFLLGSAAGPGWPCHAALMLSYEARSQGLLTGAMILASTLGGFTFMPVIGYIGDTVGLGAGLYVSAANACVFAVLYAIFYRRTSSGHE